MPKLLLVLVIVNQLVTSSLGPIIREVSDIDNLRSPERNIELFSYHFLSCYHKIVSHSHKLTSRYHKILSCSHKLGSRSHKLAKSLPQDINLFPQVSKVITTRY